MKRIFGAVVLSSALIVGGGLAPASAYTNQTSHNSHWRHGHHKHHPKPRPPKMVTYCPGGDGFFTSKLCYLVPAPDRRTR